MAASVKSLKTTDLKCKKCNGVCFNTDQSIRQANVRKMFGILPNACVDGELDGTKCPFAK